MWAWRASNPLVGQPLLLVDRRIPLALRYTLLFLKLVTVQVRFGQHLDEQLDLELQQVVLHRAHVVEVSKASRVLNACAAWHATGVCAGVGMHTSPRSASFSFFTRSISAASADDGLPGGTVRVLALPAVSVEVHPPSLNCSAKSPTCMSIGSIVLTVGRFSWLTDAAKPVSTELAAADAAAAAFFEREKESESFVAPASEKELCFFMGRQTGAAGEKTAEHFGQSGLLENEPTAPAEQAHTTQQQ